MFYESLLFPETIALGMQGGPRFATTVAPSPSGDEALMRHWALELGAWDLVQANRTDAETQTLLAFFRLACGRAHGFRFHDRADDLGVAQLLGVGDGVETVFQLVKHYTEEALTYTRTILKPIVGTVEIFLDGVPELAVSISHFAGLVTFDTPPAADVQVTATFRFHVPVRFDMDACVITMVEPGISTWAGVRLVEPGGFESVTEASTGLRLFGVIDYDEDWIATGVLTWTLPDTGDEPLLGYRLYRRPDDGVAPVPTVLLFDTADAPDPLLREYIDAETSERGPDVDGHHTGGYTYVVEAYTALEVSPPSNLVWLATDPTVPPLLLSSLEETAGPPAGTGFLPTHYAEVTLSWTPASFPGGEPVDFTELFYAAAPDAPATLVDTFPVDVSVTLPNLFGDYQGGPSGPTYAPAYTPALDGNTYEAILRGAGYTFQVVSTSVTGKTSASNILTVQHLTYAPSNVQGVTATFVDAGPFFSYVTFTYERPASLHGNPVYFYYAEYDNGGGWTPLPSVGSTADEYLGSSGDNIHFTGNSGFANRPGSFQIRFKAQNDWGMSPDWAESNLVTWT